MRLTLALSLGFFVGFVVAAIFHASGEVRDDLRDLEMLWRRSR